MTLEYSLLESAIHAHGSRGEDSFPLYLEIVRVAIAKKESSCMMAPPIYRTVVVLLPF